MNFFIPSLIYIVYFLPVNGENYIELLNNDDVDQNVADMNRSARKVFNEFNIYVYKPPIPNVRKSLGNNKQIINYTESELTRVINGHTLQDYLSPGEIHEIKVKEICEFIKSHYLTAQYFFAEMRRIIAQREVKDDLRNMVTYFEKNPELKPKILEAYRKMKVTPRVKPDIWSQKTNNLIAELDATRFK